MYLIDGKKIAKKIEEEIRQKSNPSSLLPLVKGRKGGVGGLAAILVGDNPASRLYVSLKEKAAKRVGIKFEKIIYPVTSTPSNSPLARGRTARLEKQIINKIKQLNARRDITGIIVQLPLPKNLNTDKIIAAIKPEKDADGFHPQNQKSAISPVLQAAVRIIKTLKNKNIKTRERKIVLVSNSKIFPIPFQSYFGKNLMVCKFKDIKKYLPSADIIITAVGKKHYLKGEMVKSGAVIIDIGIARVGHHVYGDADPKSLAKKRGHLTPVPGGVGPVTVACLLLNTVK